MATKPYKLDAANQTDFETHFTVVCYDDDQAVAAGQVCRSSARTPASRLACYPYAKTPRRPGSRWMPC